MAGKGKKFVFSEYGIYPGDMVEFSYFDVCFPCKVLGDDEYIECNGEKMTMRECAASFAETLSNRKTKPSGIKHFLYKGERLYKLKKRMDEE